ncbi:MAG: phage major capsid protein [Pseudomonadota bacterium]|nr:phage major capsid protein [Pseudomonadota bacterium]
MLDDVAGLALHINTRLAYGLRLIEEAQILAGDGTGVNVLGLIPQASAYNTLLNNAGDTKIDKIRHAILQLELTDNFADGIVLNPTDWESIELVKTTGTASAGQYILSGPLGQRPGAVVAAADCHQQFHRGGNLPCRRLCELRNGT